MAKCRICKRSVKWIQVTDGNFLKWVAVDPKNKPYRRHDCPKIEKDPNYVHADRKVNRWWLDED